MPRSRVVSKSLSQLRFNGEAHYKHGVFRFLSLQGCEIATALVSDFLHRDASQKTIIYSPKDCVDSTWLVVQLHLENKLCRHFESTGNAKSESMQKAAPSGVRAAAPRQTREGARGTADPQRCQLWWTVSSRGMGGWF